MYKISFLILVLGLCSKSNAQNRVPMSALTYLNISPVARYGAWGALGQASAHSSLLNVASTAFEETQNAVGIAYTPWNRALVKDMYVGHVSAYGQTDERGRWNASFTYFSYGKVELRDEWGNQQGMISPFDMNVRIAHARKLTPQLSVGAGVRFLWSNPFGTMTWQGVSLRPLMGVNADLGVYWQQNRAQEKDWFMDWGISIHNIGGRISYGDNKKRNFQPTLFRASTSSVYKLNPDKGSTITLSLDALKQLAPTPPIHANDGQVLKGKDPTKQTGLSTIFTSWGDAPDGWSEEWKEIWWSGAVQYQHHRQFALRTNYFSDHSQKGNRHLLSLGLSLMNLKMEQHSQWGMDVDFSYIASLKGFSPLNSSFQIGLTFKRP